MKEKSEGGELNEDSLDGTTVESKNQQSITN